MGYLKWSKRKCFLSFRRKRFLHFVCWQLAKEWNCNKCKCTKIIYSAAQRLHKNVLGALNNHVYVCMDLSTKQKHNLYLSGYMNALEAKSERWNERIAFSRLKSGKPQYTHTLACASEGTNTNAIFAYKAQTYANVYVRACMWNFFAQFLLFFAFSLCRRFYISHLLLFWLVWLQTLTRKHRATDQTCILNMVNICATLMLFVHLCVHTRMWGCVAKQWRRLLVGDENGCGLLQEKYR